MLLPLILLAALLGFCKNSIFHDNLLFKLGNNKKESELIEKHSCASVCGDTKKVDSGNEWRRI